VKEIKDFIDKAEKFLATAEHACDIGDYDSCVSRCYYAMFFMAEAALLTINVTASSHKGVISLFGERLVKPGIFGRDMGKALNEAYDERLIGDYGIGFIIREKDARDMLARAEDFVRRVKGYLETRREE